jgi:periplasmic divalent cation tolerance protein
MTDVLAVFVTIDDRAEASRIAGILVREKLAACVNIIPGLRSIYTWQGEVCDDEEHLMVIKTQKEVFEKLEKRIRTLHSYEVPEIIALPVIDGSSDYLKWVMETASAGLS